MSVLVVALNPSRGRAFFRVKFACLWVLWLPRPSKTCTPGQFSGQCPDQGTCLESRISLQALHIAANCSLMMGYIQRSNFTTLYIL